MSTETAPGVVDAPSPAVTAGGFQHTICTLVAEIDELNFENASLRSDLAAARQAAYTAQSQLANYTRTGW